MNSPAMVWWGNSVFKRARKINLAASEKVRIFASDFNSEINEALYLRLASGNLRNFYDMQEWYDGSRVLAWTVPISTYQGNSQDLH